MPYRDIVLNSQKGLNIKEIRKSSLYVKAKFGPSKITKIPLTLSHEIAFSVGVIIGDGHLKKRKLQITIELANKKLLRHIREIFKKIFYRKFNIHPVKVRSGKKPTFNMCVDSKAIYNFLNKVFEVPIGKKSSIVKVPKIILSSNNSIKAAFLIGIMVTEGGKRGKGLSTASKGLWLGVARLFKHLKIVIRTERWTHKRYKKEYYGLIFKKEDLKKIMRECRSGQTGQILSIINV